MKRSLWNKSASILVLTFLVSVHGEAREALRPGSGVIDRIGQVWVVQDINGNSVTVRSTDRAKTISFNKSELTLATSTYRTPSGNVISQGDTFIDKDGFTRQVAYIDQQGRFVPGYRDAQGVWHQGASPEVLSEATAKGVSVEATKASSRTKIFTAADVDYNDGVKRYLGRTASSAEGLFGRMVGVSARSARTGVVALDVAQVGLRAASEVVSGNVEEALSKGQCPRTTDREKLFNGLAALDLAVRDQVLKACGNQRIIFGSAKVDELKKESKVKLSQVRCEGKTIRLVHGNGTVTQLEFEGEDALRLMKSETVPDRSGVEYYPGEKFKDQSGRVFVYSIVGANRHGQDESWNSYLQRRDCWFDRTCNQNDVAKFQVSLDDSMSPRNPFGYASGPNTLDVVNANAFSKKLLTALDASPLSYSKVCEGLGGKTPAISPFTVDKIDHDFNQQKRFDPPKTNQRIVN